MAAMAPAVGTHPTALDGSHAIHQLAIDAAWRPLVEEVCVLKEALDLVSRWPEDAERINWVDDALARVGLEPSDFEGTRTERGLGMPHGFLRSVLGSWFTHGDTASERFRGLADMPEWSVVGWLRLDRYVHTSGLPHSVIVSKAREVLAGYDTRERVVTYGFEGVPLLWAGEGKNRTQLFRLAGVSRRSELVLYPMPDVSQFVARPLLGMPGFTVLSLAGKHEVLPFGDLSRRLLIAMGVRWSNLPMLAGWTNIRSAEGTALGTNTLTRLGFKEKRIRMAMIGGLSLAGLEPADA